MLEKRLRRLDVLTDGGTTFEAIAREWHSMNKGHWVEQHAYDVLHSMERDVFPDLGAVPIKSITAANVLSVLRKIENRPAVETARRIRQRISVFVYVIASPSPCFFAMRWRAILAKAFQLFLGGRQLRLPPRLAPS
jgi:integrase